jgi:hypothetical protein
MRTLDQAKKLLAKKRESFSKISKKHYAETEALLKEIIEIGCDHSNTTDYRWEHDNGYGRQSNIVGKKCIYCGWIDSWGRGKGNFSDPKNFVDRSN